jgi:hypothetical protein
MPFPRWIARVNLHVINHLLGPIAQRLRGMGVVIHTGRNTHRRYRTPVMVLFAATSSSGENHVNPEKWQPLIYNSRHYFGLGIELRKTFRAEV